MAILADERRSIWHGIAASPGAASGVARVVHHPDDLATVHSDEILVARHGTPSLLPALVRARAAICETGGQLSHLAILARELGKPCVSGLPGVVDAIATGTALHVDGTAGTVALIGAAFQPRQPAPDTDHSLDGMVPVLQFGRFSATFERSPIAPPFTLEAAVRTAALVGVPLTFKIGRPWPFAVTGHQVLVAEDHLRAATGELVAAFESGALKPAELSARYRAGCSWEGWADLTEPSVASARLLEAVRMYVVLNQLTWAAAILKEPLLRTYGALLAARLPDLDAATRTELLLDSLTTAGQSYILQVGLRRDVGGNTWSTVLAASPALTLDQELAGATLELVEGAQRRHTVALRHLRGVLVPDDAARAETYATGIARLVEITERKNTDLHRCGRTLFAGGSRRQGIARLFGIEWSDGGEDGDAVADAQAAVERILAGVADEQAIY